MKYAKRLFGKGDNIFKQINDYNIVFFSNTFIFIEEIFSALEARCLYIEIVRDPIYMFKQIKILFEEIYNKNPKKFFTFTFSSNKEKYLFYDFYNDRNNLTSLNKIDNLNYNVVNYLEKICNFYFNLNFEKIKTKNSKLILLPFENFVIKPDLWIGEILNFWIKLKLQFD